MKISELYNIVLEIKLYQVIIVFVTGIIIGVVLR